MKRLKSLGLYQKVVLLLMTAMILVFTLLYPVTIARVGYAYGGAVLVPSQEDGSTVYSGRIKGKQASFTVYADKTVEFQYGDKTYGPYTFAEDPTAIPKSHETRENITGVELRQGDELLFRGGFLVQGGFRWLYNEDGSVEGLAFSVETGDGIVTDEDGNIIDPMEPTAPALLDLMTEPELTHKGKWSVWFGGVFICVLAVISVLFADELFRLNLSLLVNDADRAEPADWEIMRRYVFWTLLPLIALAFFIGGLQ